MITCQDLTTLVTAYTDGQLSWGQRCLFRVHLGMCVKCRNYIKQLKSVRTGIAHLPPPEIPEGIRDELMTRFRAWPFDLPNPDTEDGPDDT